MTKKNVANLWGSMQTSDDVESIFSHISQTRLWLLLLIWVSNKIRYLFLYFYHFYFSISSKPIILFPTAPPESHQETLPLPGSAEPKWPHVSLGNKKDALIFLIIQLYSQPVFTCFSWAQWCTWEGAGSGTCSCCDWLHVSMPWAWLESRYEAWRWCHWRSM